MSEKILITGAAGYLGMEIHQDLRSSNIIKISRLKKKGFTKCDLLNKQDISNLSSNYNIKKIINLAGFVPKKSEDFDNDTNLVNEEITQNLALKFKCDLYHFSTLAIYEKNKNSIIFENNKIEKPISKYSISKLNSEKIIKSKYQGNYMILRIPGIFGGTRKDGLIYNFITKILDEKNKDFQIKIPTIWSAMYIEEIKDLIKNLRTAYLDKKIIINYNYTEQMNISEVINYIYFVIYKKKYKNFNIKNNFYINQQRRKDFFGELNASLKERLNQYINILKNVKKN